MHRIMHLLSNIFCFLWMIIIVDGLWGWLETLFYGEVQLRRVDDVMQLVWSVAVVAAYYRGRRHGENNFKTEGENA